MRPVVWRRGRVCSRRRTADELAPADAIAERPAENRVRESERGGGEAGPVIRPLREPAVHRVQVAPEIACRRRWPMRGITRLSVKKQLALCWDPQDPLPCGSSRSLAFRSGDIPDTAPRRCDGA